MRDFGRVLATVSALCLGTMSFAQNDMIQQQVSPAIVQNDPNLKAVRVDQKPGAKLPVEAKFKDDTGKEITFGSLFQGRPVVLLPIFYRCKGVCNIELEGVLTALKHTPKLVPGRDLEVVALGINPNEGPDLAEGKKQSTLDEYGKPQTAAGWHFLTGDMANIRLVTDAMGFDFTYDPAKDVVNHPSSVLILTPQAKISSYMLSGMYPRAQFENDVAQAGKEVIAPKSEELFFGCVCVDPVTGKRSLVIQKVLELLGIATVLCIGVSIFAMSRRPKVA